MQILLLSDSDYLLGLLKGYCLNADSCDVKTINDCQQFYNEINNKPPTLIFIDMAQVTQLFKMAEWSQAEHFIKDHYITLCGYGKLPSDNEDLQLDSAFEEIFPEPHSEDKILIFVQEKIAENKLLEKERRTSDRRAKHDRRGPLEQISSIPTLSLVSLADFAEQQQQEEIKIGSLLINRLHKVITINDIPVGLSHKEFEIIEYLAANPNRVVETKDIIKNIWEEHTRATNADVYQYMHMLRKKIEVDPQKPEILITVKGFGYELRAR